MGIGAGQDPLARHSLPFFYNPINKEWEPIEHDSFKDIDIALTWVGGKPTQIVITNLTQTKTMVLSWTGDELNSIATVIT